MSNKKDSAANDNITTAILLADSFDHRFTPITLDIPRALCPLVNVPLIHYTMEFLIFNGIKKIYIFCCAHGELIEKHLRETYWKDLPDVELIFKNVPGTESAGSALRCFDVDDIDTDFLLISGDVISNMKLQKVFESYKRNKKKDPRVIMTSVFKKASPHHRSRAGEDATIVAVDKQTQQLLYFNNSSSSELQVDLELFKEHNEIEFRYDLIDCRIDICSPQVILLFQSEFDWQDLRQDFIGHILEDDLLDYKIHVYAVEDEYAARVRGLNTYAAITKDIIHRWTYPLVPDNNICGYIWETTSYSYKRPNIYKEKGVKLARSCKVGRGSVLGSGTTVGDESVINHSILGRNCQIGKNVTITNSYLWGDVIVEDNCVINESIICNRAQIKFNTTINSGCLISFDCVIGPNIGLEEESRITKHHKKTFLDFTGPTEETDLGDDGVGYLWVYNEGDTTNSLNFNPHSHSEQTSKNANEEAESRSVASATKQQLFRLDIYGIIRGGIEKKTSIANIRLEINSAKYSYDSTWPECASAILVALLRCSPNIGTLAELIEKHNFKELLKATIKSEDEEEELIFAMEEFCEDSNGKIWASQFVDLLFVLYDKDIFGEEAIRAWGAEHEGPEVEEAERALFLSCSAFFKWLDEAEEEEEEEGEEGDEEDEEGDEE